MSSTIKIKRPDMPVPAQASVTSDSVGRYYNIKSYTLAQMVERDAQWQEMVGQLLEIAERAKRLVEHADFKLGGILSANSKASEIPSNAASSVKARHLASLRDSLAALSAITEE